MIYLLGSTVAKPPTAPSFRGDDCRRLGTSRPCTTASPTLTSFLEVLPRSIEFTQYAAGVYRTELAAHDMLASMSAKGDCYDNAVAESFVSTLEFELLMQHDWHTRNDARRGIFRYLETWYNPRRRHSTLGYLSPVDYEQQLQAAA